MMIDEIKAKINNADIVTFDVFDTLITRQVLHPVDVFSLVDLLAKKELNIQFDFKKARINAERSFVGTDKDKSYNINDIYAKIKTSCQLTDVVTEKLLSFELFAEQQLAIPRKDALELFLDIYNSGKKIVLVSDMYLSTAQISVLLKKCGYPIDVEMYVSNEYKATKSNGTLWKKVIENFPNKKILHLGDNKHSDYDIPKKCGIDAILMKNSFDKLSSVEIYKSLFRFDDGSFGNSLLLGKLANQIMFNNAFTDEYDKDKVIGLWMGPVLAYFMRWLIKNRDDSLLLFVTREGYILQPAYLEYCKIAGIVPQKNCLFYTSRRAASAASVCSETDFIDLLEFPFEGSIGKFLSSRCNYTIDNSETTSINIKLPRDKDLVLEKIKPMLDDIILKSSKAKEDYITYVDKCCFESGCADMTIVDIGYQGTTQYLLSKLLEKKINGEYFLTVENVYSKNYGCTTKSIIDVTDSVNYFWENINFFEASLQVPYGQVNSVIHSANGDFDYVCGNINQISEELIKGQEHYLDYLREDAVWYKQIGKDYDCSIELIEVIWVSLIYYNYLPKEFISKLLIDDDFLGNNIWHYDFDNYCWKSDIGERRLIFYTKSSVALKKKKIKDVVKKMAPVFLYEPFRNFWLRYIK